MRHWIWNTPDTLASQGLISCSFGSCFYGHPLLEGLLASYLPPPEGLSADEFYDCVSCYEGMIDQEAWDGPAFAEAMQSRIVAPGAHAQARPSKPVWGCQRSRLKRIHPEWRRPSCCQCF